MSPHSCLATIGQSQMAAAPLGTACTVRWPEPMRAALIYMICLILQTFQPVAPWTTGDSLCQAAGRHLLVE